MLGLESRIYAARWIEPAEPPKGGTPNGGSVKLRPSGIRAQLDPAPGTAGVRACEFRWRLAARTYRPLGSWNCLFLGFSLEL